MQARIVSRKSLVPAYRIKESGKTSLQVDGWWSGDISEMHETAEPSRDINPDNVMICSEEMHNKCMSDGGCCILHTLAFCMGTTGARRFLGHKPHGDLTQKMRDKIIAVCVDALKNCRKVRVRVLERD